MFVKQESLGLRSRRADLNAPATIMGIGTSSPETVWTQSETVETLAQHFPIYANHRIRRMFENCGIDQRHFAIGPGEFNPSPTAGDLHQLFAETAPKLARKAAARALKSAGVTAADIDQVVVATCTGYLCPGLSVHLIRDLELSPRCQRADLVGMGCAGAMPALQRAFDFVQNDEEKTSLLVAVEVCSACWYVDDTIETVVGNAICGDGAAALVVRGGDTHESPFPQVLGFETEINTDWIGAVGLENMQGRQRIILSKEIRNAAGPLVKGVVDELLSKWGLQREDIAHWVFHAGGAAVLSNIEEVLEFTDQELKASRSVLRNHGNISSPTTLFVLNETQRTSRPQAGEFGIALALGPGLATEAALLRW